MIQCIYPLLLGALSRLHGSELPPRKVWDSLLYAAPYTFFCWYEFGIHNLLVLLAVLCLTAMAKSAPHLAFLIPPGGEGERRSTWLTYIVDLFYKERDTRLWISIGWAFKGLLIAAPAALAIVLLDANQAAAILLCGTASSALGYWFAYRFLYRKFFDWSQWGEFLTGFIAGIGFIL